MIHTKPDEHGKPKVIQHPSKPSPVEAWMATDQIATVTPGDPVPETLNGIALSSWDGQATNTSDFEEPPFDPGSKKPAAGAVIVEPDGRVWLMAPTNAYGGYKTTFPKGRLHGDDLQKTAIQEVFEETGLQVELFQFLTDSPRSTTYTRYYLARRVGGNPADMGWEAQAVHLCPVDKLKEVLNQAVDHEVVDALWKLKEEWDSWFEPFRPDPLLQALANSASGQYLGNPKTVQQLLAPYFISLLKGWTALKSGNDSFRKHMDEYDAQMHFLTQVFEGQNADYTVIGTWNTRANLGEEVIKAFDLDTEYCDGENLTFVLSEGLAAVSLRSKSIIDGFIQEKWADPDHLLSQLGVLQQFTASVLMGTRSVYFPNRTLKTFVYIPEE